MSSFLYVYRLYTKNNSASETAIEFVLLSFNCSVTTYKCQCTKLLDVIAVCSQLNMNAVD